MLADAVLAVVLKAGSEPPAQIPKTALAASVGKVDKSHFNECLMELLAEMFGSSCIEPMIRGERVKMCVDKRNVWINLSTLEVQCDEDEDLQQMVSTAVTKLHRAITPIKFFC